MAMLNSVFVFPLSEHDTAHDSCDRTSYYVMSCHMSVVDGDSTDAQIRYLVISDSDKYY